MALAFPASDLERSSVISKRAGNHFARRETRGSKRRGKKYSPEILWPRHPLRIGAFRAERNSYYRDGAEWAIRRGVEKYVPTFYLVSAPPLRCKTGRSVNLRSRERAVHYELDAFEERTILMKEENEFFFNPLKCSRLFSEIIFFSRI